MNPLVRRALLGLAAIAVLSTTACIDDGRPDGWSTATHDKSAEPNYDKVFDITQVRELHIKLGSEEAETMHEDLVAVSAGLSASDPIYVPATLSYEGDTWEHVGVRYRGSLKAFTKDGVEKLSLRLRFDEFEDDFPEIDNQRFYGFQTLVLSANAGDPSLIREVFVSELMRDRGVPAARAVFVRVWVDSGQGPVYWGLYTLLEDPSDDPMLRSQFGSDSGNAYKASGPGADWFDFHDESYDKKTNQKADDYADIEGAIDALLSDMSPARTWREDLEARFDVDGFLRWLAVDTVMQNEDSYGKVADNYYLYGDPKHQGRLSWIPWDHNQTLNADQHPPSTLTPAQEMFHELVDGRWPLIQRTLADATYQARYRELLDHARKGLFAQDAAVERLRELHVLISQYVVGDDGEQAPFTHLTASEFEESVDGETGLEAHVRSRHERVRAALEAR